MNYSKSYFELDSEEATHCDHCHLICIKGHVQTVDTKDQSNAMLLYIVYGILFVDTVNTKIKACNTLNAIFVETVDTGVALTQHYIQSTIRCENSTLLGIQRPLTPASREGYLLFEKPSILGV